MGLCMCACHIVNTNSEPPESKQLHLQEKSDHNKISWFHNIMSDHPGALWPRIHVTSVSGQVFRLITAVMCFSDTRQTAAICVNDFVF